MVYAGDSYIQYPVKDLYDKDIMKMSLAVAKDMYEKGLELIKDFYKEYGDFLSPILKDMEWYDLNVTGKVRDTISNLYANGIDPLRSAEGRAAVALLIYSMPTGDISKVRLSAETAKEYVKNRARLQAAGKYNEDLNVRYLGYDLDNYSTLDQDGVAGSGVWNVGSPLESMGLKELTESSFNNRTAHDLTKEDVESFDGYTYDPRARYTGFTKKDLRQIADKIAPGLYGTPYFDYYRDLAKQQVIAAGLDPTNLNVNALLAENIALSQDEYLIKPNADYGDWYKRQSLALQREANALRRAKAKNDEEKDAPTTFMDRLRNNVFRARLERLGVGDGRNSVEAMKLRFGDIVGYWDKTANSFENKGKVVGQMPDEEVTTPYDKAYPRLAALARSWGVVTQGMMVKEKKLGKKIYDQLQNKQYNRAVYERDRWAKMSIGQYEVSKYDTSEEAKAVRTILKKDPKTVTAIERAFVEAYQQKEYMDMVNKTMSNAPAWSGKGNQPRGTMSTEDLKKKSSDYWDTFEAPNLMPKQNRVLGLAFSIKDDAHKDANLSSDVMNVRFGRDYAYAPIRQANLAGPGRFKYNDIHSMFNRWLTNENSLGNSGIMFDQDPVRAAHFGDQLDILARPRITKEQFDDFYIRAKKKLGHRIGSKEDVAKKLGLGIKKETLNYKDEDDTLHSTDTYYEVPVIRTVGDNGTFVTRDINELSDAVEFTPTIADKNIINSENDALLQRYGDVEF